MRLSAPLRFRLLLTFLALLAAGCGGGTRWNVLLVTFDTTRADRLGAYGYEGARTPTVDALAGGGVRFAHTFTAVPVTAPSHATILTGKLPIVHGVRDNGLFVLPEGQLTLAEILGAHGYATAAAIGSFPLLARFGLDQGFDLYDDHVTAPTENVQGLQIQPRARLFFDERPASWVNEAVLPWLEVHHREPFFLWVHYFDPHQPHAPPPPYDVLFRQRPYDGEIAYSDEAFGLLLDRLEELGVAERTLVAFTADHGEGLGEHRETTHALQLYGSTMHVPLILRWPGGPAGRVVEEPTATVDLLPTILDLLRLPLPEDLQGRSLLPAIEGNGGSSLPIYMETLAPRFSHGWGELRALFDGRHKYIHGPRPELFDLQSDPGELHDLVGSEEALTKRLARELSRFLREEAAPDPGAAVEMDEDTRRRLMALGYLQGSTESPEPIREELRDDGAPPQDHVADISRWSLARQQLYRGRGLEGRETVLELLRDDPGNPIYLELLAIAETLLGRLDEAEAALLRILDDPEDEPPALQTRILLRLARLRAEAGESEAALELARRAEEAEPTPEGSYLIAILCAELERTDEELEALERALDLDPTYAPARVDLAVRLAEGGRHEVARDHLLRAMEDQPYFSRSFYNFGVFLTAEAGFGAALPYFERAVVVDPTYWSAHLTLVEAYLALGREEEARHSLQRLRQGAPGSPEALLAAQLLGEAG